jgi:hypothetical protein
MGVSIDISDECLHILISCFSRLQEKILAPRVLHFSNEQVFWECRRLRACESFPDGVSTSVLSMITVDRPPLKDFVPGKVLDEYGAESTKMKASYWQCVVDSYGTMQLSFTTDRLIALSGIAREVQKMIPSIYVAGIWQDQLPHSLLWRSSGEDWSALTPKYIAPSWSWASVTRSIYHPAYAEGPQSAPVRACATVLDTGVTLANTDDPFGQVTDGYLHIRGRLGVMKWSCVEREPLHWLVQLAGADMNLLTSSQPLQHHSFVERSDLYAWAAMDDAFADVREGGQAYFLPIQLPDLESSIPDELERVDINGLLLAYLPSGKFKRIGQVAMRDERAAETFETLTDCVITII